MTRPSTAAVRALAGFKEPCVAATTANVDLATGGLVTIDGIALASGDRVLVKNQTDASQNGIYTAGEGEWYRAPDAASARNIDKLVIVGIQRGTVNAGRFYAFDTLDPDIGTDAISLVLMDFSGGTGVTYATVAETRAAATGQKVLTADLIEGAAAFVALTDAASVALDWDSGVNFSLTLGGNRTLANPTNGQPGTWRHVLVTQDGTGSRALSFGSQYKFTQGLAPTLSTAAGAVDALSILCVSATSFNVYYAYNMLVPA